MILRYLIRALKFTFLFFLLGLLIFVLTYLFGKGSHSEATFMDLVLQSDVKSMVIFFVAFGLVYPLIGYVKQKVYLNRAFEEDKEEIIRMFSDLNFVLQKEEDKKLYFRHRNTITRIMRLGEDKVEVDYSDNPVVVSGLRKERKDAYRLSRMIQHYVRQVEQ